MKIFEPIDIKGMHLKNRIGMPPFLNMPGGDEDFINDQTVRWFEVRAEGGAGLVMTGNVMPVEPSAQARQWGFRGIGIYDDKFIPGLKKLVERIHQQGAKMAIQLHHGGVKVRRDVIGQQAIGASKPVDIYVYQDLEKGTVTFIP